MDNDDHLGTKPLDLDAVSTILKSAKIPAKPTAITPLIGGANNRVFRLDFENSPPLVLKSYFQHPKDPRPRLKTEFEFLSFAWEQRIRNIPRPLYQDPFRNLALYAYISSTPASSIHSNAPFVQSALTFLSKLNQRRTQGKHLPYASEACLDPTDYFQSVEKRLDRLLAVPQDSILSNQLHSFLKTRLIPRWTQIKNDACKSALHHLKPDPSDWIITPSDFGLHNVLISSNQYYFIDFEYAGWDDPVKTICDFFLQPKIPISMTHFDNFSQTTASLTHNKQKTLERANLLFPLCKIKWCCIILNVFLDTEKSRRQFANLDLSSILEQKLTLAHQYLTH